MVTFNHILIPYPRAHTETGDFKVCHEPRKFYKLRNIYRDPENMYKC